MNGKREYQTGLAPKVREHIQSLGHLKYFRCSEVARALGEPTANRVREVFRDMIRRGEIRTVGPARYKYQHGHELNHRRRRVLSRIFRAMYAKGSFSAREIVVLSDAEKSTVHKRIRRLVATGYLVKGRWQKSPRGNMERLYQVRNPDTFFLKFICPKKQL